MFNLRHCLHLSLPVPSGKQGACVSDGPHTYCCYCSNRKIRGFHYLRLALKLG